MASNANVAVVTGGSGGIGTEIIRQMLDAGYEVVSLALKRPEQAHPRLHAVVVDLMDPAATQQAAVELAKRFAVTHFVHNAGVIRSDFLSDMKLDDLNALSQLHLGSAITLAQAVLPSMKQSRFGRIVLMSSRGALGLQTRTAYAATKSGMMGMARTWALELAADGITVNNVLPGFTETGRIAQIVRDTIVGIGYDSSDTGFDGHSCGVSVSIGEQSSDIASGVDNALEQREAGSIDPIEALDGATGERAQLIALAITCAAHEANLPKDAWRGGHEYLRSIGEGRTRYLTFLTEAFGYALSDIEKVVTGDMNADDINIS